MSWIELGLLSAITISLVDVLSKYVLKDMDFILVGWGRLFFATPFLILLSLFFLGSTPIAPEFWLNLILLIPLELTALILYMKGLKLSPLSLTIPFLSLTPIFLIITSSLMLKESPSLMGISGILLISIGSYMLNIHTLKEEDIFAPIKAIGKEKGALFMIGVAFIYSITSNLGKRAIIYSSPKFMGFYYIPILSLFFTPILPVFVGREEIKRIRHKVLIFLLMGVLYGSMMIFHCFGISSTEVPYFIAIKRTSILFSVIFGGLFFKEEHIRERFFAAFLMVIGAILIYAGS